MLADVGRQNRLTACRLGNRLDDRVGLWPCRSLLERLIQRAVSPRVDPGHPLVVASLVDLGNQQLQYFTGVSNDGNVSSHIFPNLGRVDIDVDDEGVLGKTTDLT